MRRYLLFGALAVVAIAAGFSRRIRPADPPAPKPVEALVLSVDRDGPAVRLRWDAAVVRKASYGELEISDGSHQTKLPLNQALLASGSFSYIPITRDVAFRLEIPGEPAISGFAKPTDDPPPPPVLQPAPEVAAEPAPPKPRRTASAKITNSKRTDTKPSPLEPPEPEPSHAETPVRLPEAAPSSPVQLGPPPPVRSAPPSRSGVSMEAEPAPPSTIGRVVGTVGRLPLLRRLRKSSEARVPPTVTFQVTPVISIADRRTLTGPLVVDVRVTVDETGKVESAEPVGEAARNTKFATAAAAAARRWKFAPARVGETAVPAKLILHFRFQPADQ